MKTNYKVKFTDTEGKETIFEFLTENVTKAISDYCRTKPVANYEILEESAAPSKQILFG